MTPLDRLARAAGVTPPTARNLLTQLVEKGWLTHDPVTETWSAPSGVAD